jgi:hypothetical protein
MVGPGRLELPTSRLSGVRSNHLSYGPVHAAGPNAASDIRPSATGRSWHAELIRGRKRDEGGGTPPMTVPEPEGSRPVRMI